METSIKRSNPNGLVLERHCKKTKMGKIGKDILNQRGAQGGIIHKQENVNLSKKIITNYIQKANQYLQIVQADKEQRQKLPIDCPPRQSRKHKKVYLEMAPTSNREATSSKQKNQIRTQKINNQD